MRSRCDSIKFLEACDPSLRKEGTEFNAFFGSLKLGEIFRIDQAFDTNLILDIARKQYGMLLVPVTGGIEDWKHTDNVFEVSNYSEIKKIDSWFNDTINLFSELCREERVDLMERVYKKYCRECMAEDKTCNCEYGSSVE